MLWRSVASSFWRWEMTALRSLRSLRSCVLVAASECDLRNAQTAAEVRPMSSPSFLRESVGLDRTVSFSWLDQASFEVFGTASAAASNRVVEEVVWATGPAVTVVALTGVSGVVECVSNVLMGVLTGVLAGVW